MITKRDLPVTALFLSVLIYPINASFGGLRLLDVFFIVIFVSALPFLNVKRENLMLSLGFWLLIFSSVFLGAIVRDSFSLDRLIFFYKYFFVFGSVLLMYNLSLSRQSINRLARLMYASHIVLSLWVFFYVNAVAMGFVHGSLRVSFPFSNDYVTSDAHLYSSVLAIGLIFFTFTHHRIFDSRVLFFLFLVLSIGALLLTGSRTGVVTYVAGLFFYALLAGGRGFVVAIFAVIFMVAASAVLPFVVGATPDDFLVLFERIFSTEVAGDSSFKGRIRKMMIGIEDAEYSLYLLGVGVLHSSLVWYDSLIGVLVSHVGIIGAIFFAVLILRFWRGVGTVRQALRGNGLIFTVILLCYLLANAITEYFLISRSFFPFLVYTFILREYARFEASAERSIS